MPTNISTTTAPRLAPSLTIKPVSVRPAVAWQMLGVGKTKGYEEILPQLDSWLDGNTRQITVESIEAYAARKLAAADTAARKQTPGHKKRKTQRNTTE